MPAFRAVPLLVSCVVLLGGCLPARPPSSPAARRAGPVVVNTSQWPRRSRFTPLLRTDSAPLVAFDSATLDPLPGCALSGRFVSRSPPPELAARSRVISSEAELDRDFPLRDPLIRFDPERRAKGGLPLAWMWVVSEERSLRTLEDNAWPSSPDCAGATHAVIGVSFGAAAVRRHQQQSSLEIDTGGELRDVNDSEPSKDAAELAVLRAICAAAPSPEGSPAASTPPECKQPLLLTLAPLGRATAIASATLLSVAPPEGERWSMSVEGGQECQLPCARWLLSHTTATLERSADGTRLTFTAGDDGGEREMKIGYQPDSAYPWLGIGLSVGGGGLAAVGFGVLASGNFGDSRSAPGSSSGLPGGVGQKLENLVGLTLLGALGVLTAGWGVVHLARGQQSVPALLRVAPVQPSSPSAPAARKAAPFTVTPNGFGLRF